MHLEWFAKAINHYWTFCFEVVFRNLKVLLGAESQNFLLLKSSNGLERALIRRIDQSLTFTAAKGSLTLPLTFWHLQLWVPRFWCLWGLAKLKKISFFPHTKSPRDAEWNGWMSSVFYFSGNEIYSSLVCFLLEITGSWNASRQWERKICLHIIRRISMQHLIRLYSVSRTKRRACIHYKHDLQMDSIWDPR